MLPQRRLRAALFVAVVTLLPACRSNRAAALLGLVPSLEPELALHLANDDPEGFQRYAAGLSHGKLGRAYLSVRSAPPTTTIEEFVRVETALEPYAERLVSALSVDPRIQFERRAREAYRRRPAPERMAFIALLEEANRENASTLSVDARAAGLLRQIERFRPYSQMINLGEMYGRYAALLNQLRRSEEIPHWLNLALEATRDFGDEGMACQILGTLGVHYRGTGDTAAMRCAWDSALVCARRIDSWQEGRILVFWGVYYQSRGQLALARDLLLEAQDRCRQLGATEIELRFTLEALSFFAGLGCWEVVGRGLSRAEMAYADGRRQLPPADAELEGTRLDVLRARYAAAIGHRREARNLARAAANRSEHWSLGPARTAAIRLQAAKALNQSGASGDARRLLEAGLEQCKRAPVPELEDQYLVELAQTVLDRGELVVAESLLARYSPDGSRLAVRHATLALRLAMQRGDRRLSFDRLREALGQLAEMESTTCGSPEGYIALAVNDELRRAGHEILDRSPEAGYGFEMWWRTPAARRMAPTGSEAAFVDALEADARRTMADLAARDAMHCVYDVRDDGIVRFTASGEGIVKERIDYDTGALRAAVHRVRSMLGELAPEPVRSGPELYADLHRLGSVLLPESLRRPHAPHLFLTTANDCLAQLPFESLDIGASRYEPLIGGTDVAWVRCWDAADAARGDSALVVCEPTYPASLRRRHPVLNEALPSSVLEAADAAHLLPGSTVLTGAAASKRNLVERWQRARLLYIAGHFVQEPEVPYVMFVPMAAASENRDAAYLEVADIRAADLSRCELVVLSGCASGAAYISGQFVTPSLADVFVDAGACAVVSTSWAVRDDDAARFMREFLRHYVEGGEGDAIAALGRARRAVMAENSDPRSWAGFEVTICKLPKIATGPVARAAGVRASVVGDP